MKERLTEWDEVRQIYRLKPESDQGDNIQKLGRLEDLEEKIETVYLENKGKTNKSFSEDWNEGFDVGMCFIISKINEFRRSQCSKK